MGPDGVVGFCLGLIYTSDRRNEPRGLASRASRIFHVTLVDITGWFFWTNCDESRGSRSVGL